MIVYVEKEKDPKICIEIETEGLKPVQVFGKYNHKLTEEESEAFRIWESEVRNYESKFRKH